MIAYSLSNTYHTEKFIDLPKLFVKAEKIYPPYITNIEVNEEFNLDTGRKPLLDKPNALLPKLSHTRNMVRSSSHRFPKLNTNQKIIPSYKIETKYWNEKI